MYNFYMPESFLISQMYGDIVALFVDMIFFIALVHKSRAFNYIWGNLVEHNRMYRGVRKSGRKSCSALMKFFRRKYSRWKTESCEQLRSRNYGRGKVNKSQLCRSKGKTLKYDWSSKLEYHSRRMYAMSSEFQEE